MCVLIFSRITSYNVCYTKLLRNTHIQEILDKDTDPWGIKVAKVEIKHIDLPQEMQRAMAKQAEAERERRAKVIAAEGEFQASAKLADAAKVVITSYSIHYTKLYEPACARRFPQVRHPRR